MQVSAATAGGAEFVAHDKTGFNGLTSETFMKLLIAQLQNQDPLEPVGNDELLSQMAMMRNLQSNIELGDAMKAITSDQQLATAASFIGKSIEGTDINRQPVSGVVDRAFLANGEVFVGVGSATVALKEVRSVSLVDAA
jgi:flagellar basal-body rod modification protein FlgD